MLLKIVMMKMLMGNMRRPLSTPTMISCQVICSDPGREREKEREIEREQDFGFEVNWGW